MIVATDVETLKQHINELYIEHRDLDDVISQLSQSHTLDQLQLQRLKKRKLHLKDQIAMLERQLTPDVSA
ncbi:MAG: YdcH family protein [Burkholderiales bacterium]